MKVSFVLPEGGTSTYKRSGALQRGDTRSRSNLQIVRPANYHKQRRRALMTGGW
jgi:hypothetical protein